MFHSSNPTLFGRTDGVLGEAEVLRRTIGGLRRVSHELSGSTPEATIEARRLLATLSTSLVSCFNATEAKNYFGTIVAECPALVEHVQALCEARERLQLTVTSARRLAFRSNDPAELGRRIGGVVAGFESHEHSECDLLQRFFLATGRQTDSVAEPS